MILFPSISRNEAASILSLVLSSAINSLNVLYCKKERKFQSVRCMCYRWLTIENWIRSILEVPSHLIFMFILMSSSSIESLTIFVCWAADMLTCWTWKRTEIDYVQGSTLQTCGCAYLRSLWQTSSFDSLLLISFSYWHIHCWSSAAFIWFNYGSGLKTFWKTKNWWKKKFNFIDHQRPVPPHAFKNSATTEPLGFRFWMWTRFSLGISNSVSTENHKNLRPYSNA